MMCFENEEIQEIHFKSIVFKDNQHCCTNFLFSLQEEVLNFYKIDEAFGYIPKINMFYHKVIFRRNSISRFGI